MKKGLIVLDLDETLLTRKDFPFDGGIKINIYLRPYLDHFLSFLCHHPQIDIGIWSAGRRGWVNACCQDWSILGKYSHHFVFIWSRFQCCEPSEENNYCLKPLQRVKKAYPKYQFYLQIDDFLPKECVMIPKEFIKIKKFSLDSKEEDKELLNLTLILKEILDDPITKDEFLSSRAVELYQGNSCCSAEKVSC